jgi:CrcB protein
MGPPVDDENIPHHGALRGGGGYTTFSTFSLDAFYLMERGQTAAAAAYMIGSVILSVGALVAAIQIVRGLLG